MGKKVNYSDWSLDRQKEYLDNMYLELGDTYGLQLDNPLLSKEFDGDIAKALVGLSLNKDYLGFFAKAFLNTDLFPYQLSILQTLSSKRLPILIASRGGAKTTMLALYCIVRAVLDQGVKIVIAGAGLRQSGLVFASMHQIWNNAPILRDIIGGDGPKRTILGYEWNIGNSKLVGVPLGCVNSNHLITTDRGIMPLSTALEERPGNVWSNDSFKQISHYLNNGVKPTKKLTTREGYELETTLDHKIKVWRDNKIKWIEMQNIVVGDRIPIDRTFNIQNTGDILSYTADDGYILGAMIGDGTWYNQYYLRFTTQDLECLDYLNRLGEFKKQDKYHYQLSGKQIRKNWMDKWGLTPQKHDNKVIPDKLFRCSHSVIAACLSGLFDTDGHVSIISDKRSNKNYYSINIGFTNTSKILVQQIQQLLLRFGIISNIRSRPGRKSPNSNNLCKKIYELLITGKDAKLFAERISFRLTRKRELLNTAIENQSRSVSIKDIIPIDYNIIYDLAKRYQIGLKDLSRRKTITHDFMHKSLLPRLRKSIYKEQSEIEFLESISNNNIYYATVESIIDSEAITADIGVPENETFCANGFIVHNSGEKIRGLRANVIVCDEFSSINPDVFETVLRGFAAVQSHNTFSKVQDTYRKKALIEMGLVDIHDQLTADEMASSTFGMSGNQIILSGTCSYQFNHFYKYFDDYKRIILNRGIMENGAVIADWRQYAIIRIPYDHLPMGLMDETILEQGAAIMDNIIFRMEYGAVFPKDSAGFYPASVINAATCPMKNADGTEIRFSTELYGDSAAQYVMGIDPASERDNLTINITRLFDGYRGCVYSWSTNRRRFEEDKKANPAFYTDIFDYNTFIVRKIRDLCTRFNITRIHLDCGGGGRSIVEGLKDPSKLQAGESLLLDMDDPEVSGIKGMHIIKLCQFTNREWYETAHYNLLKDLTAKNYIFAEYDSIGIEKTRIDPNSSFGNMMIDTHEIVAGELEQTKYQTTLIEETSSAKGMKKWDLPKLIGNVTGDIKARIRKDHFTALLLSNDAGRAIINTPDKVEYTGGMGLKGTENLANYHNSMMYQGRGLKSMAKESSNLFRNLRVDQRESGDGSVYY